MKAIVTIAPDPTYGPNIRRIVVDCPHGTTTGMLMQGAMPIRESEAVRLLIDRHYCVECCACTAELRERYSLAGLAIGTCRG